MLTVSQFDTKDVRPAYPPQSSPKASATVRFHRSFLAPPRIPYGFCYLDIGHTSNIRVTSAVDDITAEAARFQISTYGPPDLLHRGIINSLNLGPGSLDILCGEHTRNVWVDPSAPASMPINFERPFITPPKVVVFFNCIDLGNSTNFRVFTTATNIETRGFTLNIDKWGDSVLWTARVGWVAYPQDRGRIFSASVNTKDIRSPDQPQLKQSQRIGFGPNVEFTRPPSVFVALNEIDFGRNANLRVNAYVDGVSMNGLTWHIDSWGDTALHSAGITIIAVN